MLVWVPSGFLIVFGLYDAFARIRAPTKSSGLPWTLVNVPKWIGSVALILLHVFAFAYTFRLEDKGYGIPDSEKYSHVVRIGTYVIAIKRYFDYWMPLMYESSNFC